MYTILKRYDSNEVTSKLVSIELNYDGKIVRELFRKNGIHCLILPCDTQYAEHWDILTPYVIYNFQFSLGVWNIPYFTYVANMIISYFYTRKMRFLLVCISIPMYLHSILVTACDMRYTNSPLYGLRCVSTVAADIRQAFHPQCIWRCLRIKACHYVNHNSTTGQCELGLGQCESLQSAGGFLVNAFGPPRQGCVRWGSSQEPGWVTVRMGLRDVARIMSSGAVLIGNYYFQWEIFWANKEGVSVGPVNEADQDIELLIKDATCPLPWIPYTAGEPLPFGAVAGGHLDDGSATYVAKVIHNGYAVFGYYNPTSYLAFYETNGIHTTTSMDILMLI